MNQLFLQSFSEVNKKYFNNEYALLLERFVSFFNVSDNSIQTKEELGKIISSYYNFMKIFKKVINYNTFYKVYAYKKSELIEDSKEILLNHEFASEVNVNILSLFCIIQKEQLPSTDYYSLIDYKNHIKKITEQKLSRKYIEEAFDSLLNFLKKWEEELGYDSLDAYTQLISDKRGLLYYSDTSQKILTQFLAAYSHCKGLIWTLTLNKDNLLNFLSNLVDKNINLVTQELMEEPCFAIVFNKNYRGSNISSIHELLNRIINENFLEALLSSDPMESFRNNLLSQVSETIIEKKLFSYLQKDLLAIENGIQSQSGFKVLLHGIAGTGKTELSKIIAKISNKPLYRLKSYELLSANDNENPSLKILQVLSNIGSVFKTNDFILLVDECEELFENNNQQKEFINRILESLSIPCIFIANDIQDFHTAYLRRFHYHLNVDICDYSQKVEIIKTYMSKNSELKHLYTEKIIDYIATESITNADVADNIQYYNLTQNFEFLSQKIDNKKITQDSLKSSNLEQSMFTFIQPENNKYDFDQVIGYQDEKDLLLGLEHYLLNKEKYLQLKVNMPHGSILYGSPGTGKTSIIKSLGKKCNLPVLVVSTGMMTNDASGALHIKKIFNLAKKNGPCLILLDEFEKMALDRRLEMKNGTSQSLMNQLLIEMDYIYQNNIDIFVYATCNTIDYIDPAISRSGRLEQMVEIGLPPAKIREKMLKSLLGEECKFNGLSQVIQHTTGFSFIDLESIINTYKISLLKNKKQSKQSLLFKAIHDFTLGKITNATLIQEEKQLVAYHESGHAFIAYLFGKSVGNVSIIPKSGSLGTTLMLKDETKNLQTKNDVEHEIMMLIAGRAAENVFLNKETNGSSNDFYRATRLALNNLYILSHEDIGLMYPNMLEYVGLFSQDYKIKVEASVNKILDRLYTKTKEILHNSREEIEAMVKVLMKKEEIIQYEMEDVLFETMKLKNSTKLSLIGN